MLRHVDRYEERSAGAGCGDARCTTLHEKHDRAEQRDTHHTPRAEVAVGAHRCPRHRQAERQPEQDDQYHQDDGRGLQHVNDSTIRLRFEGQSLLHPPGISTRGLVGRVESPGPRRPLPKGDRPARTGRHHDDADHGFSPSDGKLDSHPSAGGSGSRRRVPDHSPESPRKLLGAPSWTVLEKMSAGSGACAPCQRSSREASTGGIRKARAPMTVQSLS